MKVKLDRKKYSFGDTEIFDVIAIISGKKKVWYLVQDNPIGGMLDLIPSEYFTVVDENIPNNWIFRYYKYNHKVSNKKYICLLIIDMYIGPQELIDDVDFLFEVLDRHDIAIQKYYDYLKKYGKEWRTPPQT